MYDVNIYERLEKYINVYPTTTYVASVYPIDKSKGISLNLWVNVKSLQLYKKVLYIPFIFESCYIQIKKDDEETT